MCKAFSCIVTKDGSVLWKLGMDSHDAILSANKLKDDTTDGDLIKFAKIEITPDKGYLFPEDKWTLKVDENTTPRWLTKTKKDLCWVAFGEWKKQIYAGINLSEAQKPINPFKLPLQDVSAADIELLKKWDSVWDSVRASVWASVWASVGDSVWASVRASVGDSVGDSVWDSVGDSVWASVRASVGDSVWAYTGSLFIAIDKWEYVEDDVEGYPFQPCVELWKRGYVASFDGDTWRLHAGKDAKIVYSITAKELKAK